MDHKRNNYKTTYNLWIKKEVKHGISSVLGTVL